MNSSEDSLKTPAPQRGVLTLTYSDHVPSKKNGKSGFNGKVFANKRVSAAVELITRCFESQLRSWLTDQGSFSQTPTEFPQPSSIASRLPLDDSLAWIELGSVKPQPSTSPGVVVEIEAIAEPIYDKSKPTIA